MGHFQLYVWCSPYCFGEINPSNLRSSKPLLLCQLKNYERPSVYPLALGRNVARLTLRDMSMI